MVSEKFCDALHTCVQGHNLRTARSLRNHFLTLFGTMLPSTGKRRLEGSWLLRIYHQPQKPTRAWKTDSCLIMCICCHPTYPQLPTSPNPALNLPLTMSAWENPLNFNQRIWLSFAIQQLLFASKNPSSPKGIQHHCSQPMPSTISASLFKAVVLSPGAPPGPRRREVPDVPIYKHYFICHSSLNDLICSDSRSKRKNSSLNSKT